MEDLIHQSAAGWALNALSDDEERAYEAHLAVCGRCQETVAAFAEAAAALAYATEPVPPPERLRRRVLAAASRERATVITLRPRWAYPVAAAAAVAALAAVGLGLWAESLRSDPVSSLQALPLRGAQGALVLGQRGEATLVVSGLRRAPAGTTYEIWVMRRGSAQAAGLFEGAAKTSTLHLNRLVPRGSFVGVTIERAGGSLHPSGPPVFTSSRA